MNKSDFQVLVNQLAALSVEQREVVRDQLEQLSSKDGVAVLVAMFSARFTSRHHCAVALSCIDTARRTAWRVIVAAHAARPSAH